METKPSAGNLKIPVPIQYCGWITVSCHCAASPGESPSHSISFPYFLPRTHI